MRFRLQIHMGEWTWVLLATFTLFATFVIAMVLLTFHARAKSAYASSVQVDAFAAAEAFMNRTSNAKGFGEFVAESLRRSELRQSDFERLMRFQMKSITALARVNWATPSGEIVKSVATEDYLPLRGQLQFDEDRARIFDAARMGGNAAITDPYPEGDYWFFDIYVPLLSGNELTGMLALQVDLAEALDSFVTPAVVRKNQVAGVMGHDLIAHPSMKKTDPEFARDAGLRPVFSKLTLRVTPYKTTFMPLGTLILSIALLLLVLLTIAILVLTFTLRNQKALMKELQTSEQRFGTLAATASIGIMLIEGEDRVLFMNPALRRLFNSENVQVQALPRGVQSAMDELRSSSGKEEPRTLETQVGERHLLISAAKMPAKDHEVILLLTCVDVTKQKEMELEQRNLERQVLHAQKLESMGVLAAGIAHDFNNLLVGILGNASLALEDFTVQGGVRTAIERVQTAAVRASDLTRQLLNYSGKGHFSKELVSLADCVKEIAPLLAITNQKKARIEHVFDSEDCCIYADATQIHQIIVNLMTNALEAVQGPHDEIEIRTGTLEADRAFLDQCVRHEGLPPGTYAYVCVRDSGCGMSEETLDRIFDPFFTTKFTGRGLGMSSVLGIVRGHGGALHIRSKLGYGTTIHALFPKVLSEFPHQMAEGPLKLSVTPDPQGQVLKTGGEVILIVDDEEAVRDFARIALERSGYHVITAFDGIEGLKTFVAEQERIHLVLLDITMPGMGGEQVYLEVRKSSNVPIVFSSGFDEGRGWEMIHDKPFTLFLRKPYKIADLLSMVEKGLDLHQAKVEHV